MEIMFFLRMIYYILVGVTKISRCGLVIALPLPLLSLFMVPLCVRFPTRTGTACYVACSKVCAAPCRRDSRAASVRAWLALVWWSMYTRVRHFMAPWRGLVTSSPLPPLSPPSQCRMDVCLHKPPRADRDDGSWHPHGRP